MKKILLILFPFLGLNAQVTIGPESTNNTSAMLNITMPNSIFVMPVGDRNLVNTQAGAVQANNAVPEGSIIYHSNTNSGSLDDSGLFLRVKDTSNSSRTENANSLVWKPFKVNNRTYIYNNIQSRFNEQLLGYKTEAVGSRFNAASCFKWEITDTDTNANGHTYCLIENKAYGRLDSSHDSRIEETLCTGHNDWKCAFAIGLVDRGYLATITSQEEHNYIKEKLNLIPNGKSSNIAIGLRKVNVNEGDRTAYSSSNSRLVKRFIWVNGEVNKVGWLTVAHPELTSTNTIGSNSNDCGMLASSTLNITTDNCTLNNFPKILVEYNF